jgi:lipopolysaccharide export system protein LptA
MRQAQSTGRTLVWGAALAAGAAVAALAAGAAHAQLSSNPNKGPIDISADSVDVRDPQHLVIYKGRVEALQDQDRLRTDLLNIYYKQAPKPAGAPKPSASAPASNAGGADFGAIDHMEAIGNVYFVTPQQVAKGDKAVYTADNDTIVVTGDVVLTQGENVGRGSRLVINLATGNSTLEGGGDGPSGRPRTVVYPKQTPQQASKPAAPQQAPQQTPQGTSR